VHTVIPSRRARARTSKIRPRLAASKGDTDAHMAELLPAKNPSKPPNLLFFPSLPSPLAGSGGWGFSLVRASLVGYLPPPQTPQIPASGARERTAPSLNCHRPALNRRSSTYGAAASSSFVIPGAPSRENPESHEHISHTTFRDSGFGPPAQTVRNDGEYNMLNFLRSYGKSFTSPPAGRPAPPVSLAAIMQGAIRALGRRDPSRCRPPPPPPCGRGRVRTGGKTCGLRIFLVPRLNLREALNVTVWCRTHTRLLRSGVAPEKSGTTGKSPPPLTWFRYPSWQSARGDRRQTYTPWQPELVGPPGLEAARHPESGRF